MQDKETDSYWSIMTGDAVAGEFKGQKLKELPVAEKMKWKDWKKKHPDTLVLSVNGKEDIPFDPYDDYFASDRGFRGIEARDKRLGNKTLIFAFEVNDKKFAIPSKNIEGGKVFSNGKYRIFLYRSPGAEKFQSTYAFRSTGKGFARKENKWIHLDSGSVFNPQIGEFEPPGNPAIQRMEGFDTFWYMWSLTNPHTEVLK